MATTALARSLDSSSAIGFNGDMEAIAAIEPVMTVPEVAAALRVDRSAIYKEIAAGNIDAIRVGQNRGTIRIPVSSFQAYVAGRMISVAA